MKLSALTIVTILLCVTASIAFKEKGNQVFDKIDRYLSDLEASGNSGHVLVAVDGEVYKRGFGLADREKEIPFTPETITTTGSITKQFTGAAILKLEMQGKLKTTDLIQKYFKNVPADKQAITLHQLLTHSAGFPGAIGDDYAAISTDEFEKMAFQTPLLFEPGKSYEYSNVGYTLLAILVEKVSGMTYEQYLRKELFDPAGMNTTGYVLPDFSKSQVAVGYRNEKLWGKPTEKTWSNEGPYWHLKGNGGMLSNAEDMYKWHMALADEKILSAKAKEKYYGKHVKEGEGANSYYGYGWSIVPTPRGTDMITHNGGNGIFKSDFLRYPKEDVVVWFGTNAVNKTNRDAGWEIARMVFQPEYQAKVKVITANGPLTDADDQVKEAFLQMVRSEGEEGVKAFVSARFAQGFKHMMPMDEHVRMMGQLREDLKMGTLKNAYRMDDTLVLAFETAQGLLEVSMEIRDGMISGMLVGN